MKIKNIYTSIGCNRTPESADWGGKENLILYGASNSVALFDPNYEGSSSKIIKTFVGHTARVNTVKWVANDSGDTVEFLSGSDDNTCILWDITDLDSPKTTTLRGHSGGVSVLESIYVENVLTIATTSSDSTIKFWHQNENQEFVCFQTISLGNGLCFAIRMCRLPNTDCILLALATDDDKIHLYGDKLVDNERVFQKVETFVGHEDWVRGLDFVITDDDEILLASSSQDTFIRLWKISPRAEFSEPFKQVADLLPDEEIKIEERIFAVTSKTNEQKHRFAVSLESVLLGHDGWVYGVHWNKQSDGTLQLLSSSIDKTLIIWTPIENGVWMERIRVGDVGGNSLGFFGGKFSANGKSILGHGYHGSFHIWHQNVDKPNLWLPGVVVGGHFGDVRDLAWDPKGQYLITLSADQTTRIHVPWIRSASENTTWHELARPQVHGYDMQTIALLTRYRFASGAEEKIVRTFQAPGNFVENFRRIVAIGDQEDDEGKVILESTSKGASVPSLGLSNKIVYDVTEQDAAAANQKKHIKDEYPENYFVPVTLNAPPPEETLMQNTLWPEVQKLYGHGYEVFALCATSTGSILASSCKATNAEHAQIILWNTTTWKQIQKLESHLLTVTQMKFSLDDKFLLSVSRDRRWSLFELSPESNIYELIATTDKKNGIHGRIIWTCDWSHDSKFFATGSRDGKCAIWARGEEKTQSTLGQYKSVDVLELKNDSITALAFLPRFFKNETDNYLIGLGLESGIIQIYNFYKNQWTCLATIDKSSAHHLTIKKIAFRPCESQKITLASCGEDHLVRLYALDLE